MNARAIAVLVLALTGCDTAKDAAKQAGDQVKKEVQDYKDESKKEIDEEIRKAIVDEPEAEVAEATREQCLDVLVRLAEITQEGRLSAMSAEEKDTFFSDLRKNPPPGDLAQCQKAGAKVATCIVAAKNLGEVRTCETGG